MLEKHFLDDICRILLVNYIENPEEEDRNPILDKQLKFLSASDKSNLLKFIKQDLAGLCKLKSKDIANFSRITNHMLELVCPPSTTVAICLSINKIL